jgi:Domain of unknown function (DUF3303)
MKFMVQFRLQAGSKNKALEAFELRGPNRNPGVALRDAWFGTESDVVFVLVESEELALVEKAGQSWAEFGSFQIVPVIDVQQL